MKNRAKCVSRSSFGTRLKTGVVICWLSFCVNANAELLSGNEVVEKINGRTDGEFVTQKISMELTNKRGATRSRTALAFRKNIGDERRSIIFFEKPSDIRDTGFLTFDYAVAAKNDDQWLYLPEMRKVRRIAGSDRGGAFLGTDFSFEDVKLGTRVSTEDFVWTTLREEQDGERNYYVVEAKTKSRKVARDLRYQRAEAWVDSDLWIIRRVEFWDTRGKPLKTIESSDFRLIDDILTPHRVVATTLASGHQTVFTFSEVNYSSEPADSLFSVAALRRGKP